MDTNEQQPWYNKKLQRGESLVISNPGNLPDEAYVERAYLKQEGIKSSVLIPLAVGGTFLVVVGFACLRSERQ